MALLAERAVVGALDAGCHTPVGALASARDDGLELSAYVGLPDGGHWIRDELAWAGGEPAALGRAVAERLLAAGAGELLAEAERAAAQLACRGWQRAPSTSSAPGPGTPG